MLITKIEFMFHNEDGSIRFHGSLEPRALKGFISLYALNDKRGLTQKDMDEIYAYCKNNGYNYISSPLDLTLAKFGFTSYGNNGYVEKEI